MKLSRVIDNEKILIFMMIIVDYLAVICAAELAIHLRSLIMFDTRLIRVSWLSFWVIFPANFLLFISSIRLYSSRKQFWEIAEKLFYASTYATVAIVIELYLAKTAEETSRLFILLLWLLGYFCLVLFRYLFKEMCRKLDVLQIDVLIIGAGQTAEKLVHGIKGNAGMGYRIIGFLEDNTVGSKELHKYPVLGKFAEAEAVIRRTGVQHVIIAAPGMEQEALSALIYRVQPLVKNLGIIPNLVSVPMGGLEAESLFNEHLMLLRVKNNLALRINRAKKIVFDYVLTLAGLLVISPLLLVIAVWIYKDSPGPIIFKHIRIGKDGRAFPCYKFRTMCTDARERLEELLKNNAAAREEWERDFKLKNDPRITRSGAFLRKTSLDELPQIFNVLKGEMSLVGPRPVIREELERYGDYVGDYLMVKPGITGMWQVSGRSDTTYEERVQMDSWYVRNWSVWLDIMLLWRTIKGVYKCEGAY